VILATDRLRLRTWEDRDRDGLAAMHAHPEVMADYGGVIDRAGSDAKLDRYATTFARHGFGRWLVETPAGEFLGYAGVAPGPDRHPLGPHFEVGWRFTRAAWGHGYATEAAKAALADAFGRAGLTEILSYTAPDNLRSQAVMGRLGLERDASRDFTAQYDTAPAWRGLVWVARPG
jgi:RimJ/RimL family protein N-acetyltransferase